MRRLEMFAICSFSEEHRNNYLNETDFELMAKWGLNHVRIPMCASHSNTRRLSLTLPQRLLGVRHFGGRTLRARRASSSYSVEKHLTTAQQLPYLYRAIKWAAKHNIRVMMDLHGVPGSQNGCARLTCSR